MKIKIYNYEKTTFNRKPPDGVMGFAKCVAGSGT